MIVLLAISVLLSACILLCLPFSHFDNPYILWTTGQIVSRPLTMLQIGICIAGLFIVFFMNFCMMIGYLTMRTKVISIISIVFVLLATLYTWVMCLGHNELQIYPNDLFLFSISVTIVGTLSVCAAVVGIAKSRNPEREKIKELAKELEELKSVINE